MKHILSGSLLVVVYLLISIVSVHDLKGQISSEEVPANVKNSFNRIYIDHDPEVWYMDVIKPKGGKKTKRYTAAYVNKGRRHLVRFDSEGLPVGEYYELNEKMSNHVTQQLSADYPDFEVDKVESLWMFRENVSVFVVHLMRKSKTKIIFVDDDGKEVFDPMLTDEFSQS